MSDNQTNNPADAEYEDLRKTLDCVEQITREFENMSVQLRTNTAQMDLLTAQLSRRGARATATPSRFANPKADPYKLLPGLREVEQSFARQTAQGKQLCQTASTFAQALTAWAEDLEKRKSRHHAGKPAPAPTPRVEQQQTNPDESCSHDNSGGNPGVLIYTNNRDTYTRYTKTESAYGQLASACVTYVAPNSAENVFLATDNPLNVWPSFDNVTYSHRVTINQGESWYYYAAQIKEEESAFIEISAETPLLLGFSASVEIGTDYIDAVDEAHAIRIQHVPRVDAGIPWGAGIKEQGNPWEKFNAGRMPPESRLPPGFETFDSFNQWTEVAGSEKTLYTATASRIAKPKQLYSTLAGYIDKVAEFSGAKKLSFPLNPDQIRLRVLKVAIPWTTTPEQMEQINEAIRYGNSRRVLVTITKTK
jgi:hypothetical protein